MQYSTLPNTSTKVSKICLGTMTWGQQNTQQQAFEQMDYAVEQGVNFFDTAEIYAVPPTPETYGKTETIIGNWFQQTKKRGNYKRNDIILASKMAGSRVPWIRDGRGFEIADIEQAVNDSLKRLQTDYIDVYQLHWPQRQVQLWGKLNFENDYLMEHAEEQLSNFFIALNKLIDAGKIRHIGLSNETPWGVMKYVEIARQHNLPQPVTNQNAYSIIRREYDISLSEISLYENIGLLAYSPLAGGILTGKYQNSKMPENSRFALFPDLMGYYASEKSQQAVADYQKIANELNISLTTLSLSYVNDRPFTLSNIIGATNIKQLAENIASINTQLTPETLQKIDNIFSKNPNPGNH